MNRVACICLTAVMLLTPANAFAVAPKLKLTENRRFLQYENGKPFFYLGDTAWELFHRLNREEATQYLTNRSQKGFTVIQAVVLAQLGGLTVPNPYGDLPLMNGDPAKLNEAYFRHVDFIANKAEELGLFVGMLPTWGSYWAIKSPGNKATFNPTNAREYGRFLGARYKDKPIIWVLGGDRSITNDTERAIIDAMAAGLTEGDGGVHLKTFHHPIKPTLDGEPRYEGIPVGFYNRNASGIDRFDDYDVRQAAYWSLLAGACGFTYGNNNIWQIFKPAASGTVLDSNRARDLFGLPGSTIGANIPWHEALDHPGAFQMRHVRRLFESLPFTKLIPDQSLILNGPTTGGAKMRAARASDGSFALFYSPHGESFTLNKNVIKADQQRQYWFDPRYGIAYSIKDQDSFGIQTFAPPTSGRGNDWLLVLTNAASGFSLPGTSQ